MSLEKLALFKESLLKLEAYIGQEGYKGWDPYDGLNSRIFQSVPWIKKSSLVRLVWIQFFKKSPVNLRRPFLVPKGYNSKGIALFLTGYCNVLRYQQITGNTEFGCNDEIINKINLLGNLLISFRSNLTTPNSCWGYDFDWQSKAFFLPAKTPTIVATAFAVDALLKAYSLTNEKLYLDTALSSASFIKSDLNRIPKGNGFMFSYSPLDKQAVYNATLLATKTLSKIYQYTGDEECKKLAFISGKSVCDLQNDDGSFPHSDQVGNDWRDNFHTAFKLESLASFQTYCSDYTFKENIERGFEYWTKNFFDRDSGIAYYYDSPSNLIDLHCTAQAIPTFYHLNKFKEYQPFLVRLIDWAIYNMQDKTGYFYYQRKGRHVNRIPYMRWPNAWMFYGMSYYLIAEAEYEKTQGDN